MSDDDETVTSAGAAAICGVSRSTFNSWVQRGVLPEGIRDLNSYGGRARYSKTRLENWVADKGAEGR